MLTSNSVVLYDVDGLAVISATGAAVPVSAVFIGGTDGTNLRALKTDTAGNQTAVGPGAVAAPPSGNPLYSAGTDGTNLRALLTDTTGRQIVVGAAADGAAVTGNPVLIAGQDGTNTQSLLTDNTGKLLVTATTTAQNAGTATLSNVAASATSVSLLASNANRLGVIIKNDGNKILYVKFGATASVTSYTTQLPAGAEFTMSPPMFTGAIDGIWNTANGSARITELTA